MLIILSPAKTFNKDALKVSEDVVISAETSYLLNILKTYSVQQFEDNLAISHQIATDVFDYYNNFKNEYYAIYLYGGTAFKYLNAKQLPRTVLKNVYILSALYGLINGFDLISKYRLDLKDKIINGSLTQYWFNKINTKISHFTDKTIINLSSGEYGKLLDLSNKNIITITFGVRKNNKVTSSSMMLKKMRGLMANYLLTNKINNLKSIEIENFKYDSKLSTKNLLVFIKEEIWN